MTEQEEQENYGDCSLSRKTPVSYTHLDVYKRQPLMLPEVDSYMPTDNGESPLAAMTDWVNTTCPCCGEMCIRDRHEHAETFVIEHIRLIHPLKTLQSNPVN